MKTKLIDIIDATTQQQFLELIAKGLPIESVCDLTQVDYDVFQLFCDIWKKIRKIKRTLLLNDLTFNKLTNDLINKYQLDEIIVNDLKENAHAYDDVYQFVNLCKKSKAQAVLNALEKVTNKSIKKNWQGATWFLEKSVPELYAKNQEKAISNNIESLQVVFNSNNEKDTNRLATLEEEVKKAIQ